MKMTLGTIICVGLACSQAYADPYSIEQLGTGSREAHPPATMSESTLGSTNVPTPQAAAPANASDYQDNIINNPYTSPLARTEAIPANIPKGKPVKGKAADKKAAKKMLSTEDKTKPTVRDANTNEQTLPGMAAQSAAAAPSEQPVSEKKENSFDQE